MAHAEHCRMYIAANCAVGVECPHGFDVCPQCDPCTCVKVEPVPTAPALSLAPEVVSVPGAYYRHERG